MEKNSLLRLYMHKFINDKVVINKDGVIIDLGTGEFSSYSNYIKNRIKRGIYICLDAVIEKKPTICANLENTFPLEDQCADIVMFFNILEHLYDIRQFLAELYRVLKNNGRAFGFVPFMHPFHPDPEDYFRFTKKCLQKLLVNTNFINIDIIHCPNGIFGLIGNILTIHRYLHSMRVVIYPLCSFLDNFIKFLLPRANNYFENFTLGYFITAQK